MSIIAEDFLPDSLLDTFRERAVVHDRENTFPDDDLRELREAGYLAMLVPADRGGLGLGLVEASVLQQRIKVHIGTSVEVRLEEPGALPRSEGKYKRVYDLR